LYYCKILSQTNPLPSVAVVILNWNGKAFLEKFLPSVVSSTYTNLSIIVADNASTDDSVDFLRKSYPSIKILQNQQNEGFAKGYNTALKQVTADYYVLLNSDVEVEAGWIEPVISLMESDPLIAACQPKIRSYNNKEYFEYAGACGGWIDSFGYPFNRGRLFDVCEIDRGQYDDVQPICWATGASMFVRSELFHKLGGFDDYFFAHQEEIDLCWRLQHQGYKIFVQPASVVYHVGGGTLPMGDKRKVFLNFRNNLVMLTKNFPGYESFWKIPFRMGLDWIAALKGLFRGSPVTFTAIMRAHYHYITWLFSHHENKVPNRKRSKRLAGHYHGLVIWKYFINKKRVFSAIVRSGS